MQNLYNSVNSSEICEKFNSEICQKIVCRYGQIRFLLPPWVDRASPRTAQVLADHPVAPPSGAVVAYKEGLNLRLFELQVRTVLF